MPGNDVPVGYVGGQPRALLVTLGILDDYLGNHFDTNSSENLKGSDRKCISELPTSFLEWSSMGTSQLVEGQA